ncbi:MAG: bacillithiol biosynthesis cysteine-adding enzyme BshC [Bacteroidia bacterium]|nr:bacillithiol biosynthesis cysteine-adding enzyme BshC [Bacteroidia bacterium]
MKVDKIPYCDTGYFSSLICDYLDQHKDVRSYYNHFPKLEEFVAQIKEKSASYPNSFRPILQEAVKKQNEGVLLSKSSQKNIELLGSDSTFTVVTGHQLNLFTGPLYVFYKIISVVNLCAQLKKAHPKKNFVPVFWMATEDHDFDEINHFTLHGKKWVWNSDSSGAVGHFKTSGLEKLGERLPDELGTSGKAQELATLFKKAYEDHDTLTAATRYLANELFGSLGLVIIDGDDKELKKLSIPLIERDILEQVGFQNVNATLEEWKVKGLPYKVQVNPREINYFYLIPGLRERIVFTEGEYQVMNSELRFSESELKEEIAKYPERFSPNVIMRPVYQEYILPNLCYIGGGGEIAYWLELKSTFEAFKIPLPVLLLRNSALLMSEKQGQKLEKLQISLPDIFLDTNRFINKKVREISNIIIDFNPQKEVLQEQFKNLHELAAQTDASFLGAVKAQERKQVKGLEHLEKRLVQAQKRKLKDQVGRMTEIQQDLFPNGSLQERQVNFSQFYLELGEELIQGLQKNLDPLDLRFTVLRY